LIPGCVADQEDEDDAHEDDGEVVLLEVDNVMI
jgi:hypothetical protein